MITQLKIIKANIITTPPNKINNEKNLLFHFIILCC